MRVVRKGEDVSAIANDLSQNAEFFNGDGADVCIECSGVEQSVQCAMLTAAPGGTVVMVGMGPSDIRIPVIKTCMRKEVDLRGVFRYANCYPKAISMVASGKVDVKPLITHRFKLEETVKAFEAAREGGAVKVMIKC